MFKLGFPELVVIFLAVILLFGTKALPEIARGLAQAVKNFRKGAREIGNENYEAKKDDKEEGE